MTRLEDVECEEVIPIILKYQSRAIVDRQANTEGVTHLKPSNKVDTPPQYITYRNRIGVLGHASSVALRL